MAATDNGHKTSFGFRQVDEASKADLVHDVFAAVAGRYDVMNDVMSGGVHRLWKRAMVAWLKPRASETVVDLAGGTGDIAFRMVETMAANGPGHGRVIVTDVNADMIGVGRDRAQQHHITGLDWVVTDAENLALPDNIADAVTIAFGIRNCTHIDAVLGEAFRLLKPGGRFACLEFSTVQVVGLSQLYDAYSFHVVPRMGQVIAHNRDAYAYLVESIRRFPDQDRFAEMLRAAGFGSVKVRNYSGGIVALHTGWKI